MSNEEIAELAMRFETGGQVSKSEVEAALNVEIPTKYKRLAGLVASTDTWGGLCTFVYETLTGVMLSQPTGTDRTSYGRMYLGKAAARALRTRVPNDIVAKPVPVTTQTFTPADTVKPTGRLLVAMLDLVPERLLRVDWRGWPEGFYDVIGSRVRLKFIKIPAALLDKARERVVRYLDATKAKSV